MSTALTRVGCSQCGGTFGYGTTGYSHCSDHAVKHEFAVDLGLSAKVDCTFTEDDGDLYLHDACINGVDIQLLLTDKQIERATEQATAHFEKQGREINAERRYEARREHA